MEVLSHSVEETMALGRRIGEACTGGEVIGLTGELGAGKTHLAKGIALGLGVADERAVNSPTFVLVNEYRGRAAVYHVDAYRLRAGEELSAIGFEEMCRADSVVIVEWADRVRAVLPEGTIWVRMAAVGEGERRIEIVSKAEEWMSRLRDDARHGQTKLDRVATGGDKKRSNARRKA